MVLFTFNPAIRDATHSYIKGLNILRLGILPDEDVPSGRIQLFRKSAWLADCFRKRADRYGEG